MISFDELPKRDGVELMDCAGIGSSWPISVAMWDAPRGFNTSAKPDQQPCHVLALRLSGALVQRVEAGTGRPERLRPRGFSIHPAHQELRFIAPSAIRFAHLYIGEAFLRKVSGSDTHMLSADGSLVRRDRVMYVDAEMSGQLDAYIRRAFDPADPPTKLEMESRANLIALRLLRYARSEPQDRTAEGELAPWQVRRICAHLENNLDRTIRLEELSQMFGISREHLCRAFQRATGMPPMKWQLRKRMETARRLLATTDATLTSIAQEVGYTGQSAFGNAFREVTGTSPGQYRRTRRDGDPE